MSLVEVRVTAGDGEARRIGLDGSGGGHPVTPFDGGSEIAGLSNGVIVRERGDRFVGRGAFECLQ